MLSDDSASGLLETRVLLRFLFVHHRMLGQKWRVRGLNSAQHKLQWVSASAVVETVQLPKCQSIGLHRHSCLPGTLIHTCPPASVAVLWSDPWYSPFLSFGMWMCIVCHEFKAHSVAVLVRVTIAVMKHCDEGLLGRKEFYPTYASTSLFIIKGSQDRN